MSTKSTTTTTSSGGIGFGGLLTIVFITLKLTGVIDWPWLWVLSPIWISASLLLGFLLLGFVIILIAEFLKPER
jgi:hypothetical protein